MFARLFFVLFLVVFAVILTIAMWPQMLGLQTTPFLAHIVSLRGVALTAALSVTLLFVVCGVLIPRMRLFFLSSAALLLIFSGVTGTILVSRGLGHTFFAPKQSGDVTVLAWNTLGNATGSETIAHVALDEGANVISLPETTDKVATEVAVLMREAGSPMWAHTVAFDDTAAARSTSILISPELGDYRVIETAGNTEVLPSVIAVPSDPNKPTIVAVHAVAPIRGEMENWRDDLAWLSTVCKSENMIMAGDFNATVDHMAGLGIGSGTLGQCEDAAISSRNGAVGTWNTAWMSLLGSPIDHIMATSDWHVTGMKIHETEDKAGSDHRPIVAQLSRAK